MKSLLAFLFLVAMVFGQQGVTNKVSPADRAAAAFPLPPDTPSLTGGGLIVEAETNGYGKKVYLVYSNPGSYVVTGKDCGGGELLSLGQFTYTPIPQNPLPGVSQSWAPFFDSTAFGTALPNAQPPCIIEVIWVGRARLERSAVNVSSYQQPPSPNAPSLKLQITNEVITNGRYQVTTGSLPRDAVVILGRGALGTIQANFGGTNTIMFPADLSLPLPGATTITLCSEGKCGTSTFERKLEVQGNQPRG